MRRLCPHHAYAPTEHTTHHACTAHTHAYRRVLGKLYQVHAARLHSGAKVVVKLQHVEVARVMRQDMVQSLVLGRLLAFFEPEFDFTSLLTEANREHEKELDFNIEASNLVEGGDNLHRSRVVAEVPPRARRPPCKTDRERQRRGILGFIALIPLMTRVNRASSQHCFQVAQTPARGLTVPPEKWMFLVEKRANV